MAEACMHDWVVWGDGNQSIAQHVSEERVWELINVDIRTRYAECVKCKVTLND